MRINCNRFVFVDGSKIIFLCIYYVFYYKLWPVSKKVLGGSWLAIFKFYSQNYHI